jgi:hypothetical protein
MPFLLFRSAAILKQKGLTRHLAYIFCMTELSAKNIRRVKEEDKV